MDPKGNWMRSGGRRRVVALAGILIGSLAMAAWEYFGADPCREVADRICDYAWIDDCAEVRRALAEPEVDLAACEFWSESIAELETTPTILSDERSEVYRSAMDELLTGRMDVAAMHEERIQRRAQEYARPLPRERRNSDD